MPGPGETVRVEARSLRPCGTPAAYRRHLRRGEPIDETCRSWHARDVLERAHQAVDVTPMRGRCCEGCGRSYDATGSRQKFCPECSPWARRDACEPMRGRCCEGCGRSYDATGSRQKFCPECSPWLKEAA